MTTVMPSVFGDGGSAHTNDPSRTPTAAVPTSWYDPRIWPAQASAQAQDAAAYAKAHLDVIEPVVSAREYCTFLVTGVNAGNGYRFTEVYTSGITRTGSGGGDTFVAPAGIYTVNFTVGFGASAGKIQPRFNGSNIAVEYRALANGDCSGAFMFTADGTNALDFQNTSGGTVTPTGTLTIRRVT